VPVADRVDPERVRLLELSVPTVDALAEGDLRRANATAPVPLPAVFVAEGWISTWRFRSAQLREDPTVTSWVTGAIWDSVAQLVAGKAGFHAPPDDTGMVEVGYAVVPELRRRGYARAALEALLRRAATEPAVRVVRASVRPDNRASSRLIAPYGFLPVGEQEDEEDGLEIVYEVDPRSRSLQLGLSGLGRSGLGRSGLGRSGLGESGLGESGLAGPSTAGRG
jgi:RimJ/RimL family protein N-acetyltransferase